MYSAGVAIYFCEVGSGIQKKSAGPSWDGGDLHGGFNASCRGWRVGGASHPMGSLAGDGDVDTFCDLFDFSNLFRKSFSAVDQYRRQIEQCQ
ncbi:hypothetical protein D3C72_1764390 [compost metagenome]